MPILSNVLIQAEGDRLRLAATDLEIGIRTELVAEVNHEGLVTASARKLWEIVQEAGADEIILSASNNEHVEEEFSSDADRWSRFAGLGQGAKPPNAKSFGSCANDRPSAFRGQPGRESVHAKWGAYRIA
jgi:hypothetical protein